MLIYPLSFPFLFGLQPFDEFLLLSVQIVICNFVWLIDG